VGAAAPPRQPHNATIMTVLLLVLGAKLIGDAIAGLI
jgi:hypothetical protein